MKTIFHIVRQEMQENTPRRIGAVEITLDNEYLIEIAKDALSEGGAVSGPDWLEYLAEIISHDHYIEATFVEFYHQWTDEQKAILLAYQEDLDKGMAPMRPYVKKVMDAAAAARHSEEIKDVTDAMLKGLEEDEDA